MRRNTIKYKKSVSAVDNIRGRLSGPRRCRLLENSIAMLENAESEAVRQAL